MEKLFLLLLISLFLLTACTSVSTTHADGSQTILYPDGRMERVY